MTSDLTASISSAVSNSTLVGESLEEASTREKGGGVMDISGYHSEDEDQEEEEELEVGVRAAKQEIMNLTHITEDDIQFADD